jgi:predicted Zn-dependent protease
MLALNMICEITPGRTFFAIDQMVTVIVPLSLEPDQRALRVERAMSSVQAGYVAEAIAQVVQLLKADGWDAGQWYDFACTYAVASGKVAGKQQEYADRAMELLRNAVLTGS